MRLSNVHPPARSAEDSRDGIALVVCLGFLSVLIIMAMGFAVSMRVERLAARNNLDHVKARQLSQAALVRAINDVTVNLKDDLIPNWDGDWADGAFESVGVGKAVTMLDGYATNYVPRSLWTGAQAADNNAQWIDFTYTDPNSNVKTLGRYAYIVLDCSGLIDVNMDYNMTNSDAKSRAMGETPRELQLSSTLLTELKSDVWRNLITSRLPNSIPTYTQKPWYRMETVPEIAAILDWGFGGDTQRPLVKNALDRNFFTYSRVPLGYLENGDVKKPVSIGGDAATIGAHKGEIMSAMQEMGIADPTAMYDSLVDYVDPDNVPQNLKNFSTEAVPMINEIVVSNRLSGPVGGPYTNEYRVFVELFYPFGKSNQGSYDLRIQASYQNAPPGFEPAVINGSAVAAGPWTKGKYQVFPFPPSGWAASPGGGAGTPDLGGAEVRVQAILNEAGTAVDRITTPVMVPIGKAGPIGTAARGFSKYADDPRINWDGSSDTQWKDDQPNRNTLGLENPNLSYKSGDKVNLMYVANEPLRNVGELGYLLTDPERPWRTVRLLDPGAYPVLDRFTLSTNEVRHGLINPNGWNDNVVATPFVDLPTRHYFGESGATGVVSTAQALEMAKALGASGVTLQNLSDLKELGPKMDATFGSLDDLQKERIIANVAGLLSPRQQLFTVLLVAQVTAPDGSALAEQRGVGTLWRDPYKIGGTHEIFVRNFRWLTE